MLPIKPPGIRHSIFDTAAWRLWVISVMVHVGHSLPVIFLGALLI